MGAVYPDAESSKTIRQYKRVLREQQPVTLTLYHADFDRWVEARVFPTPDGFTESRSGITGCEIHLLVSIDQIKQ